MKTRFWFWRWLREVAHVAYPNPPSIVLFQHFSESSTFYVAPKRNGDKYFKKVGL